MSKLETREIRGFIEHIKLLGLGFAWTDGEIESAKKCLAWAEEELVRIEAHKCSEFDNKPLRFIRLPAYL